MNAKTRNTAATQTKLSKGFTLIELLVVIAIIALLVSILLPSLKQAQEIAKQAACLSNIRNFGFSHQLYVEDYGTYVDYTDGTSTWPDHIWYERMRKKEYIASIDSMFCPSDKAVPSANSTVSKQAWYDAGRSSYGIALSTSMNYDLTNGSLAPQWWHIKPHKPEEYVNPSESILMAESMWFPANLSVGGCYNVTTAGNESSQCAAYPRHLATTMCNTLWIDGHASSVKTADPDNPVSGLYDPDVFGAWFDTENCWDRK